MQHNYDIVVMGGGQNTLGAAAYLAKAGKKVIVDANKGELMAIGALEPDGSELVMRGKIYGAMPMTARLRPEEVRRLLLLLTPRILAFLLSMPFRSARE